MTGTASDSRRRQRWWTWRIGGPGTTRLETLPAARETSVHADGGLRQVGLQRPLDVLSRLNDDGFGDDRAGPTDGTTSKADFPARTDRPCRQGKPGLSCVH